MIDRELAGEHRDRSPSMAWMYNYIRSHWQCWAGLLVTALNLVPVGTLDGGHVAYGLFGEKARKIFPIAIGVIVALMVLPVVLTFSIASFYLSWLLWVLHPILVGQRAHTTAG